MKALSIKEPYANMILSGKKTIETRTWRTNYRGPLLICASAKPNILNAGHAVAFVDLVDCRLMHKTDEVLACCEIYPHAQAWILENVRPIKQFKVKGKLGIYEVEGNKILLEMRERIREIGERL